MKTTRSRILLALMLLSGVLSGCDRAEAPKPSAASVAVASNQNPPLVAATVASLDKLNGRWQRTDGDYVIEIRGAAPDGKLEAGYFNPQSINVAQAVASSAGSSLKVFIELRDVNYPGSTYTLTYDAAKDRLVGTYFQAVAGETYDVLFERMKSASPP